MSTINGVISIELEPLEERIRKIIREEVSELGKEIKQALVSKREALLQEERFSMDHVAEILDVNRRTIYNYQKDGILPEPKRDISGHPYWTPDQLERAMRLRGIKTKFPV
jgi:DNA-binding transcriptional MerR regulator